jgi:hypothetical protein
VENRGARAKRRPSVDRHAAAALDSAGMTSPDDLRWAARYDFVDELWRDRARVIFDPELEAALLRDRTLEGRDDEGCRALLDALVPKTPTDGVWMVVRTAEIAAQLRRSRPGATFLPRDGMGDLLRRADWDVALVDLGSLLTEDERTGTDGLPTRVEHVRGVDPDERRVSMLAELGRGVEQGRAVVLSAPVSPEGADEPTGLDYGEVADILASDLGGGRIYGLYEPPMAAIVDFGERIEGIDEPGDDVDSAQEGDADWVENTGSVQLVVGEADPFESDDDVPLVYDNTLGSQEPGFSYFLAVAGAELAAEGLTLVELPTAHSRTVDRHDQPQTGSQTSSGTLEALRAQLQQARRRADLAAIDRQSHLERVDALEAHNERLRADVAELRDRLAMAVDSSAIAQASVVSDLPPEERLDAAMAREQALRWRVTQLERELDALIGRPVDLLQAEVASLRARLDDRPPVATSDPVQAPDSGGVAVGRDERAIVTGHPCAGRARRPVNGHGFEPVTHSLGTVAAARATQAIVRAVEDLVRRVERGGIGTFELRRNLVALRRRLQR